MNNLKKWVKAFFKYHLYIIPLFIAIDLVSKYLVEDFLLKNGRDVVIIKDFFNITLIYNKGAFSGFLGDTVFGRVILLLLSIAGTIGGSYYLYKKYHKMNIILKIGLYLLIPGAAGNLVDRFLMVCGLQEGVIDFLHFYNLPIIGDFNVFNFADMCLTVSIVLVLVGYILDEKKNEKKVENNG